MNKEENKINLNGSNSAIRKDAFIKKLVTEVNEVLFNTTTQQNNQLIDLMERR